MKHLALLSITLSQIIFAAPINVICKSNWGIFDTLVLKESGNRVQLQVVSEEGGLEVRSFLKAFGIDDPSARKLTAEFHSDTCKTLDENPLVLQCRAPAVIIKVEGGDTDFYPLENFEIEIKHSRVRSVSVNDESAIVSLTGYARLNGSLKYSHIVRAFWTVGAVNSCLLFPTVIQ